MNMKLLLAAAVILFCIVLAAKTPVARTVPYAGKFSKKRVVIPRYKRPAREFRGVWVATVENIDFPTTRNAQAFKAAYERILINSRKAGFNAIIFQVRPTLDAFYPSRINPWSRNLTGVEGNGIKKFDPLAYMVQATHRYGMEFHAWLNPYRVCGNTKVPTAKYLSSLAPGNFARRNPQFVIAPASETPGHRTLLLDPGIPQVRQHIIDTVREIVSKYDVDAIHFDDYFYPYGGVQNTDAASYRRYNPQKLSLNAWRRNNVDTVIKGVSDVIRQNNTKRKRKVRFGISPFGIWANSSSVKTGSLTGGKESYSINYADTRKWVKYGWIDYIVPQLYWQFSHETAAYACLTDWWSNTVRGTRVKLYIGLAPYRLGAPGWGTRELADQLKYNSSKPEVAGNVMFSYSKIFFPRTKAARSGIQQALSLWK